jgi:hypothetical protein
MARPNARIVHKKKKLPKNNFANTNGSNKSVDIIVSSGRIRNLFLERCDELKTSPYTIAKMAGVNELHFSEYYINKENPKETMMLTQNRLIKMLKIVGIDVRVVLAVSPIEKHREWLKLKGIVIPESKRYDTDQKFDKKSKWC